MRLAVLSDVHGNLPALEAVLEDMQRYDVDGIIVAGDLVGGPQPNEVVRLLGSLGAWMIRGNSDSGLLQYASGQAPESRRTHLQFALLRWTHAHVDADTRAFLGSLPEQRVTELPGRAAIRVVHGSPRDPSESIYPDRDPVVLDAALAQASEPVLVCGHTHEPWKVERDGRLALNPGAVCGPLDGFVGTQYALLTWHDGYWEAKHRALRYDLGRVRAAFRDSGLLEEGGVLAKAFVLCLETGQNIWEGFLSYARGLAAQAGFGDCETIPDVVWEQAAATFDWDAVMKHPEPVRSAQDERGEG